MLDRIKAIAEREGLRWTMTVVGLLVIVLAGTLLRAGLWTEDPALVSDAALRFRLASYFADPDGAPADWPEADPRLPEGSRPREEFLLTQDALVGWSYRWFHDGYAERAFVDHLRLFTSLTGSLVAVGVFLLARLLWRRRWAALLAALVACLAPALLARSVDVYLREHLALPLILLGWAGVLGVIRALGDGEPRSGKTTTWSIVAGFGLGAALIVWHLTGFVLTVTALLLAAYLVWRAPRWYAGGEAVRVRALGVLSAVLGATTLVLSLVAAPLRSKGFYLAPATIVFVVCALVLLVPRLGRALLSRRRWTVLAVVGGAGLLLLAGRLLGVGHGGEFSHIYELLAAKLGHLGGKPADPAELNWIVSSLWSGPFASPEPFEALYSFWLLGPLGLGGGLLAALRFKRRELGDETLWLLVLTAGFVIAWLLFKRLSVFAAPLLAILGAGVLTWGLLRPWLGPVLFGLAGGLTVYQSAALDVHNPVKELLAGIAAPTPDWPDDLGGELKAVAGWLDEETPPGSRFAAPYNIAAMLYARTERSTALHSIWETPRARERAAAFSLALYADEDELYRLLDDWGVDYLVLDAAGVLDDGPESSRYAADALKPGADEAAYLLGTNPAATERFTLLRQTDSFRIFSVGKTAATNCFYGETAELRLTGLDRDRRPVGDYSPLFDPESPIVLRAASRLERLVDAVADYNAAVELYETQRHAAAARQLEAVLADFGDLRRSSYLLAECRYHAGDPRSARAALETALEHHPGDLDVLILQVKLRAQLWDIDGALRQTRMLLERLPDEPRLHYLLADLNDALGRRDKAAELRGQAQRLEGESS
ncbi:MAG: tetratricopeptide repeat protein [Candidatus Coatesbacteria bacterium]|nr:tetratricopeptide repeat protein [Candidatus Coatesbacteria bacterium]